ncbi:MAG: DOMON-like domain-containing protein [Desulfotalea sp.]
MNNKILKLVQHKSDLAKDVSLFCNVTRDKSLSCTFYLQDSLSNVVVPKFIQGTGKREKDLWKNTCFELFLSRENQKQYLEINLSPSGAWNVYAFDDYRLGMREDLSLEHLNIQTRYESGLFTLQCKLAINKKSFDNKPLQVGVAAVLAHPESLNTYWALKHNCDLPDFHDRSSFTFDL